MGQLSPVRCLTHKERTRVAWVAIPADQMLHGPRVLLREKLRQESKQPACHQAADQLASERISPSGGSASVSG